MMLDQPLRRLIDPPLDRLGHVLAARGIGADQVTLLGLALGLLAGLLVAVADPRVALLPLLLSRLADGLDGAVARAGEPSDFGGYLDIVSDFLFYGVIPAAFVIADPAAHGAAGAVLLLSFYVNGASFLGFAVLAEKRAFLVPAPERKSLYFSPGLVEGSETIVFLVLLCCIPEAFAPLAWGFALLCFLTTVQRVIRARHLFRPPESPA